jgi:hypothetical protein
MKVIFVFLFVFIKVFFLQYLLLLIYSDLHNFFFHVSFIVGLAETSPYNPLKVLHSLLEPSYPATGPTVSVIGISNWRLDNSKSSRALLVQRYGLNKSLSIHYIIYNLTSIYL